MIQKIVSSRFLWAILSFVLIVQITIFDYLIINGPEQLQVQYIPDDAYYYLGLARNFTKLGFWTFDSGFSSTSGFHPLLAYLLSLIFSIFQPTTNEFVRYSIIFHSFITLIIVGLTQLNRE